MKKLLFAGFLFATVSAQAAPFVVSDTLAPGVTHCGVLMDAAPKVIIPVTPATGGNICKHDVGIISTGSHTVRMTAITIDPVWGNTESPDSLPLTFVRPGVPTAPATLQLLP